MHPWGGKDVGSVITLNSRLFERAQICLVHRGGWTQSLVLILREITELRIFVQSSVVVW